MKRSRRLLLYALLAIAALIAGRFVETPSPIVIKPREKPPDNIDFYLSGVDYRAMDRDGRLRYRLRSPLLEHYLREDISRVQQPAIEYRLPGKRWRLAARQGEMQHRQDRLLLQQGVRLQREGRRPMQLDTERLELQTEARIARLPESLRLESPGLQLEADSAVLQLGEGRYRFQRVRAVHQPRKSES